MTAFCISVLLIFFWMTVYFSAQKSIKSQKRCPENDIINGTTFLGYAVFSVEQTAIFVVFSAILVPQTQRLSAFCMCNCAYKITHTIVYTITHI